MINPGGLRKGNHWDFFLERFLYNVRGWLTSYNLSGLSQRLHYTDVLVTPCYNGNIINIFWTTGSPSSNSSRSYRFIYDALSRLMTAEYG